VVTGSIGRWGPAVLVGVGAFVAARLAMRPGLGFWDTGELQTVAPLLGTAHPTGFPTYVLLGWLANILLTPFGEPAFRMNLFAGLCLAIAAGVTVDLVRALTGSVILGVLAGIGLTFTGIVWNIGTQAEAHALHLALVAILLWLLVAWEDDGRDRTLVAAAVVFGLAAGNHSLTLLLAPPIALYVVAVDRDVVHRPRFVMGCLAAAVVPLVLVYLELPLRAGLFPAPLVYGRPDTWDGFWYVALAEQFTGSLVGPFADLPAKFGSLVRLTVAEFGPLAALLPIAFGVTAIMRPRYALLTGSAAVLTCFFAASYVNAMIDRYYIVPVLIAWTWLAILATGLAAAAGLTGNDGRRPNALVAAGLTAVLLLPTIVSLPDRYRAVDRSGDTIAQRWVDRAMGGFDKDAIVLSWWSYSTPLWYAQKVDGQRPDIDIIDDRTRLDRNLGELDDVIDANLGARPVYVIRMEPDEIRHLEDRYVLDPVPALAPSGGALVVARRGTAG
jgi:Protein of unknown function (DUF2723)